MQYNFLKAGELKHPEVESCRDFFM